MLDIYSMKISEAERLDESFCLSRFPNRTLRSDKFYKHEDRLRCLGAGALMCFALGTTESNIFKDDKGKPYLRDRSREFSISHSGDYSVIAVSDKNVGIDIEKISNRHLDVAKTVYNEEELDWMNGDMEKFYVLWTLKESVMKFTGTGLSVSPKSFSVLPMIQGNATVYNGEAIYGKYNITGEYVISVCSSDKIDDIRIIPVTAYEVTDTE